MYYRTKYLLKLKDILFEDDESLESVVNLSGAEIIKDVYQYESLKEYRIANFTRSNQVEKCRQYLSQLNYVRNLISTNSLFDLTISPNTDVTVFESKYPLYPILNTNQVGIAKNVFEDIFEKCLPTEEINYFCFRNSLVEELGVIEFSVANFGTLLADIFHQKEKIEVSVIRASIISELDMESVIVDELLTQFLKINLIINYSLLVVES